MQCTVLYPHLSEAGTKGPENLLQGGGPPLLLLLAFCHIFLSNRALPPAETASPATCWRACTTTQSSHWQVFSTPRMRARCQMPQTRWGTGMKLLVQQETAATASLQQQVTDCPPTPTPTQQLQQHVLVSVQRRLSDTQASKSPHTTKQYQYRSRCPLQQK